MLAWTPEAVRVCFLRSHVSANAGGMPHVRPHANGQTSAESTPVPPDARVLTTDACSSHYVASIGRAAHFGVRLRAAGIPLIAAEDGLASHDCCGLRVRVDVKLGPGSLSRLGRLGGRGAGRRPALVWPFGVRANAGSPAAFALTLRAPEDDLHRIRASATHEIAATGVSPVRMERP